MDENKEDKKREAKEENKKEVENEKKEMEEVKTDISRLKKIIIFLTILIIVFLTIFIYKKLTIDKTFYYNGFSFNKINGLWHTEIQSNNLLFEIFLHYSPMELEKENISIYGRYNKHFFRRPNIYILFDPNETDPKQRGYTALAASELSLNIARVLGKKPIASCLYNITESCRSRPILNCNMTNQRKNISIIFLNNSNKKESEIHFNYNCIVINGRYKDIVKATDRFLYLLYGIMK